MKRLSVLALFVFLIGCISQPIELDNASQLVNDMLKPINRVTDSQYLYDYQKTKFVPPEGKTLFMMGQTDERIREYQANYSKQPTPAGWAAYWGITSLKGVTSYHTNETGSSQHHEALAQNTPNSVLHSALWMVGRWDILKNAAAGEYDAVIKGFAAWAKSVQRPIYLRIGYEFDGVHNELDPAQYIIAYRRIVDLLRAEGVENIALVWHSYAAPTYQSYPLSAWYPGDAYVDWIGISLFGHLYHNRLSPEAEAVFDFAKAHSKPVMIAEASPVKGIMSQNEDAWSTWFVNLFSLVHQRNIKAVSLINEDWPRLIIDGIEVWENALLQNNSQVAAAFFNEISRPRYLKSSPKLFELLGYDMASTND